jgi:diadenosine tetraphosphate (Ap4A) HIT family hydrolase
VAKARAGPISQRISCGCFDGFRDQGADFIYAGRHWVLALNNSQFFLGRSLLILRDHATDLNQVSPDAVDEFHEIYSIWRAALQRAFSVTFRSNIALLGNETDIHSGHIHWHLVPRFLEPISFRGQRYFSESPETVALNYSNVAKWLQTPATERRRIAKAIRRYFSKSYQ